MTFKKILLSESTPNVWSFIIPSGNRIPKTYQVYFTDETGIEYMKILGDKKLTFDELPKPLLKQIK